MPDSPHTLPETHKNEPVIFFRSAEEWENWLAEHYSETTAIWICYAKKHARIPSLNYSQALESALCWGWIDGQVAPLDDCYYLQRFTRRRPRSRWSQVNVHKVGKLIAAGRMQPSGMAEVAAAQADGRWEAAYPSPSTISVPDDFQQALNQNAQALAAFLRQKSQDRYSILYRIHEAKRPETRARRIKMVVDTLAGDGKIH
jgi:uncharacterized protein YdeI (YjbR/CyaY-like superfamily)